MSPEMIDFIKEVYLHTRWQWNSFGHVHELIVFIEIPGLIVVTTSGASLEYLQAGMLKGIRVGFQ